MKWVKKIDESIWWILGILGGVGIYFLLSYNLSQEAATTVRVLRNYFGCVIVGSGIGVVIHALLGVFIPKKNKLKLILTILIIFTGLFFYQQSHKPKTVQMQEGIIYKLPKSSVDK